MEPKDPTWDDTGFGPEDETFMAATPVPSEPPSVPTETTEPTEPTEKEQPERRRVEAVGALPALPEPQLERRRGVVFWFGIFAGFIFLCAVIGGGFYFFTKPTIEESAFIAPPDSAPEPVATAPVPVSTDTVVEVVDTISTTMEPLFAEAKPIRPRVEKTAESKPPTPSPTPSPTRQSPQPISTTSPSSSTNAMWVVQVFSSPSRDDADEWLQTLREKRVQDGYIVEQNLRGQPWYRVRFGQFPTREGAEAAAVNLGFRQPWIARIR